MDWTQDGDSWTSDRGWYRISQADETRFEVHERDVLANTWEFKAACGKLESAQDYAESLEQSHEAEHALVCAEHAAVSE